MGTPGTESPILAESHRESYRLDGYAIVRGLLKPEEAQQLIAHYMALREARFDTGEEIDGRLIEHDPLRTWPRYMHPHRRDAVSMEVLLDPRIRSVLRELFDDEPLAAQSMMYFKPPGSRGHALHQDQYFLRVTPGTCLACWIALDPADVGNGGMRVVPGMGDLPLVCVQPADPEKSWSQITVPLPEGTRAIELELNAGDALFFNGWTPHGSLPNDSEDRFRRCFIGHYVPSGCREVSSWYLPLVDFEGNEVRRQPSGQGGACGVWTETEEGLRLTLVDPDFEQPVKEHE